MKKMDERNTKDCEQIFVGSPFAKGKY